MHTLPQAIAGYIAATNTQAPERLASYFNADAVVHDEGHAWHGRGQIAAWARDTGTRYQFTIEATGLEEADGLYLLRATVRGKFPGSPIALDFHFKLQSGAIQSLEIKP